MYALIYDEHMMEQPRKKVISTHNSREDAEVALENRMKDLGRRIWECYTRIVWVEGEIRAAGYVTPGEYSTWRPGEFIPEGELHSDSD